MRRTLVLLAALATTICATLLTGSTTAGAGATAPVRQVSSRSASGVEAVVVRPVTAAGRPAHGFTVRRIRGTADCYGSSVSAVDSGITECFPTALALRACWKSAHHTVLCLHSARSRHLVRIRYTGRYPRARAPKQATPMDLTLDGGRRCLARIGGAWGAPDSHPNWVGFYSCSHGASVYGPGRSRDGIVRTTTPWSVRLWRPGPDGDDDTIIRRDVATVSYVGTAA